MSKILFVLGSWDDFRSLDCRIGEVPFFYVSILSLSSVVEVRRFIPMPLGVSWVSRDHKLNVKHKYIGFMPILSVIFVKSLKKAFFRYLFETFH